MNGSKKKTKDNLTKEFLLKEYVDNRKFIKEIAADLDCGTELVRRSIKKFKIQKPINRNHDLTGQRFGKLFIKGLYEYKKEQNFWECHCDCGEICYIATGELRYRDRKSCGCTKNKENLIGKKFGKLTVISLEDKKRNKKRIWKCKCDCGKEIFANTSKLKSKHTQSCGCLHNEVVRKKLWKGYGDISGNYWSSVRLGAKSRKFKFAITIKEAWNLFLKQNKRCKLTGIVLNFQSRSRSRDGTASLDRIDSQSGYTLDNVQWVHKDINRMKMNLDQQYFIQMCQKISENAGKSKNEKN